MQHGIIRSDLSGWLKLTGLARHDLLERREDHYILVLPTWRSFLDDASPRRFAASDHHSAVEASVGSRFKVDDDRLQRIDAFFAFKDQGNRKRIIDAVLAKDGRI